MWKDYKVFKKLTKEFQNHITLESNSDRWKDLVHMINSSKKTEGDDIFIRV